MGRLMVTNCDVCNKPLRKGQKVMIVATGRVVVEEQYKLVEDGDNFKVVCMQCHNVGREVERVIRKIGE